MIDLGAKATRACSAKVAFREADAGLRATDLGYAAYQCPECDWWHLSARSVVWNKAAKSARRKAQQRQRRRSGR